MAGISKIVAEKTNRRWQCKHVTAFGGVTFLHVLIVGRTRENYMGEDTRQFMRFRF